jgi:predicted deacylase
MVFEILNIAVKNGNRVNDRLVFAKKPDGEPLTIPLSIINGKNSGPVLCLNTGTHGDEPEGTIAILEILDEIDPLKLSGVLVGIPALNVAAFTSKVSVDVSGIRENPLDWKNLARIFPGNPHGTVTERLADSVVKEILPKVNYVLDFHSGGSRGTSHFIAGFVGVDNELGIKSMELAEMFPIKTLWRISPWAKFASTCIDNNIPISVIETTGQGRADKKDVDVLKIGIRNVMKKLNMLPGNISKLPKKRECIDTNLYLRKSWWDSKTQSDHGG